MDTDYHALVKDRTSFTHQCCLLCALCDDSFLVSGLSMSMIYFLAYFSVIGIQSFKGSLRRTCYLSPTLGEGEIAIDNQFCGGYINPDNLTVMGYVQADGTHYTSTKGYICPLGQICRVCAAFNASFPALMSSRKMKIQRIMS